MPWPPWKKSEPAPKSPDEIRRLQIELIESTLKCTCVMRRISNYDRINKLVEDLLSEDILRHQAALRILGLPDDADHTKLITSEFVSALRNIA